MKDLTIKKLYQDAHLSIVQSLASDHLKFILKCFEITLFNGSFITPLVNFLFLDY